jgi:hypothetical protein
MRRITEGGEEHTARSVELNQIMEKETRKGRRKLLAKLIIVSLATRLSSAVEGLPSSVIRESDFHSV